MSLSHLNLNGIARSAVACGSLLLLLAGSASASAQGASQTTPAGTALSGLRLDSNDAGLSLVATVSGGVSASTAYAEVTVDRSQVIQLMPSRVLRPAGASVEVVVDHFGTAFRGELTLFGADGELLYEAGGKLFVDGSSTSWTGSSPLDLQVAGVRAWPTLSPDVYDIGLQLEGSDVGGVAGGNLVVRDSRTFEVLANVEVTTGQTATELSSDVSFTGNPVGATYSLDIVLRDDAGRRQRGFAVTVQVVETLDSCSGSSGGLGIQVFFGSGTRVTASSTGSKPELL